MPLSTSTQGSRKLAAPAKHSQKVSQNLFCGLRPKAVSPLSIPFFINVPFLF